MKSFFYAFRSITRSPATQFIKVISLTLGLAAGLLIFAKVAFERSYDNFFPDSDRVYQTRMLFPIDDGTGKTRESDMLFGPMSALMADNIPAIENAVHTYWAWGREYFQDDEFFNFRTILADSNLFRVLDYGMVRGNPEDLQVWDNALISESAAAAMFGDSDPIGQTFLFDKQIPLTIRGIFRDVPANSQVDFDVILSLRGMGRLMGWGGDGSGEEAGGDSFRVYLKLRPGASISEVEEAIGPVMQNSSFAEIINRFGITFRFRQIDRSHQYESGNRQISNLMLWLAFLVLFISAMNYVLVSISSLERRTKAIAVQKCNGARSNTIFGQFLIETAMLIVLSLGLAVFLFFACRQQIEQLTGETLASLFVPRQWGRIGAVVAGFFLLAGVIPGRIFSRISVAHAFKTIPADKRWWKQLLLFLQLTCATFVLIFLGIVVRQYNLAANREMGYESENVVSVPIKNTTPTAYERIRQQLSTLPWVESAALANSNLTDGLSGVGIKIPGTEETFSSRYLSVEAGFLELMNIPLKYGEYFPAAPFDPMQAVINEKFAEMMGWSENPVGKVERLMVPGVTVTGVLHDFHLGESASSPMMPLVIFPMERRDTAFKNTFGSNLHIRLNDLNPENLAALRSTMEEMLPDQRVTINSYSEMIRQTSSTERMIRNLVSIAALIVFLITLTGLIGYVNDEVRRRRREIAIRKVHGASVADVITIIARSLLVAGAAALAAGTAGAWMAAANFLSGFAVQISLDAWIFIAGEGFVLLVCGATIVWRSWRAANENPGITIKTE